MKTTKVLTALAVGLLIGSSAAVFVGRIFWLMLTDYTSAAGMTTQNAPLFNEVWLLIKLLCLGFGVSVAKLVFMLESESDSDNEKPLKTIGKFVGKLALSLLVGISAAVFVGWLGMCASISGAGMAGGNTAPLYNQVDLLTKIVAGFIGIGASIITFDPKWLYPKYPAN